MESGEIARNLINPKVLEKFTKTESARRKVHICVVWGFFYNESFDFHLGHLHIIQKARDFINNQINVSFIINDHTEQLEIASQPEKLHKKRLFWMKEFLKLAVSEQAIHINEDIVFIGSEKSNRLFQIHDEQFLADFASFEEARLRINHTFDPLRDLENKINKIEGEGKDISNLENERIDLIDKIHDELLLSEEEYLHLHKMLVGKNKFASKTPWASRFGALIASWKPRIDYIFVGERHKYIWTYYKTIFKLAKKENFPVILLAEEFRDITGESTMDSNVPDRNISLIETKNAIETKFSDMPNIDNSALSDTFNYLIIPHYKSVRHGTGKNVKTYKSFKQLRNSGIKRADLINLITDKLVGLLGEYIDYYNKVTEEDTEGKHIDVDNYYMLKAMSRFYTLSDLISGVDHQIINSKPEEYIRTYSMFIDRISDYYFSVSRDTQITFFGTDIIPPLKRIGELIERSKDMDLLLYLGEKSYRDHFLHQFNVASLGWLIINAQVPSGKTLMEEIISIYELDSIKDESIQQSLGSTPLKEWLVGIIWWSAALLHDHAYPIHHTFNRLPRFSLLKEKNEHIKMLTDLEKLYKVAGNKILSPIIIESVQAYLGSGKYPQAEEELQRLFDKYVSNVLSSAEIKRIKTSDLWLHSSLGAINFMCYLDDFILGDYHKIFNIITKSILLHELRDIEIDISKDPIPFLLVLCDEIQEWGRRTILDKEYICPLDKIRLGPINERNSSYINWILPKKLRIEFPYSDSQGNFLDKSYKWSYELFRNSKDNNLGRLILPDDGKGIFPNAFQYVITIPSKDF